MYKMYNMKSIYWSVFCFRYRDQFGLVITYNLINSIVIIVEYF